ncbi:oxidase EvaA [Ruminococcaceae bacterium YRB3002]|nr:oxidase EvaA [Ruminococcaceae bacterium YRB3002]
MIDIGYELIRSWADRTGNVNSTSDILRWIDERNKTLKVSVEPVEFSYDGFWFYDEESGFIRNRNNSFFQLAGFKALADGQVVCEQPVIIQDEIGFLGIICRMIDGELNLLMQAKIEPGNTNVVQISPTIQATKSNFTRRHGGKEPKYLDYFLHAEENEILVDQVQSEQSSRFFKKRNRNIVVLVSGDVPLYDSHKWMTLGQIKEFMKIDNLVNMDTRTVISCLLACWCGSDAEASSGSRMDEIRGMVGDDAFYESMFRQPDRTVMQRAFKMLNDRKMFCDRESILVPLKSLDKWVMSADSISCKEPFPFRVIYCKIEIEDREVKCWDQPLVQALGKSLFGVFSCVDEGVRKYLVRVKEEIGCFDHAEFGPAVQLEPLYSSGSYELDAVETLFLFKLAEGGGVMVNVVQSEEGGRFYHEENVNVVIDIDKALLDELPDGYIWMDHATISEMIQFSNVVNIQLRNIMSLLDIGGE